MSAEFNRFFKVEGGAVRSAETLGVSRQRVYQMLSGKSVGPKLAKIIVDKYPQTSLYSLLYGDFPGVSS